MKQMADYLNLKNLVQNEIKKNTSMIKASRNLNYKIKNGTAKYSDAVKFSREIGKVTGNALEFHTDEIDDNSLEEYAITVLVPTYRAMQKSTLQVSKQIQKIYNANAKFGFNPVDVDPDEERLNNIVQRFRDASTFKDVSFLLGSDVAQNISRAAVTDTLRKNTEFMNAAGVETYVTRSGVGCCAWCDSMTGTYSIDDIPNDFWRVHKDCICEFDYKTKNAHTKITFSTSDDGTISRNVQNV